MILFSFVTLTTSLPTLNGSLISMLVVEPGSTTTNPLPCGITPALEIVLYVSNTLHLIVQTLQFFNGYARIYMENMRNSVA